MVKKRSTTKKKSSTKKKPTRTTPPHEGATAGHVDDHLWVDKLDFYALDHTGDELNDCTSIETSSRVRIVSWNVLAEAYLTPRSHRHLPRPYRDVVFSNEKRRALLDKTLQMFHDLNVHVLCLQEVDMPFTILEQCGYDSVLTPTSVDGGATASRVDACGIFFSKEHWHLVDYELVRLDDLATLGQRSSGSSSTESNLQGLRTCFLRRNVALLARLQHMSSGTKIVVANAHIYWNPEHDYVKLCQVHYVMKRAHDFCKNRDGLVLCGDLNSRPHGHVYKYLSTGRVNAKQVAPWYRHFSWQDEEDEQALVDDNGNLLANQLASLRVEDEPQIRYLLDFTLNRFTRWLRILGIDAALETEEEEIQRTRLNNNIVFDRCRDERRTLLTTSSKLLIRKDCPSGTYLVNAKSLESLEAALVHLLLHHGVTLEPSKFLSRCRVCNGNIMDVDILEEKQRVFRENNCPDLSEELDVYECDGCGRGYWWNEMPTSSESRVKSQATRLFELCLRGGVPIKGGLHMFDFVNVQQERAKGLDEDGFELEHLDVTDWLKDGSLTCPIPLESAYTQRDGDNVTMFRESLPFTNVTHDFVGALDYIFYDPNHFVPTEQLYVPASFKELNGRKLQNGHLLPSMDWPSDHLAVGVQLELKLNSSGNDNRRSKDEAESMPNGNGSGITNAQVVTSVSEMDESSAPNSEVLTFCAPLGTGAPVPPPSEHPTRCACGCVPKILSMFEMAELRKQARLKSNTTDR